MSMVEEPAREGLVDMDRLRAEFPVLRREVNGRPLVYLDSAASAQKPQSVIDAELDCYQHYYANVHRGVHTLSQEATTAFEGARSEAQRFLNAPSEREIIFLRGVTEAINLVAHSFVAPRVGPGDEILVTHMEHHSNIVPWQLVCERTGAQLRVVPIDDNGDVDLETVRGMIHERTRLVSVVHVSNALGAVNPVAEIAAMARAQGVPVLLDGAQAAPHLPVDIQELGVDFYAFSGHKAYGPTGIGVLWGRYEHLAGMVPYQGGGDMIRHVSFSGTEYAAPPARFEAGTPNIAGAIGLGEALRYIDAIGRERIAAREEDLVNHAAEAIAAVPGVQLIGRPQRRAGAVSFVMEGTHPNDLAMLLDEQGIAIRAGHHCAQPVMERFGVPATARASFGVYNTHDEVESLVVGLEKIRRLFG
ncbi:aminotransferase class V-fold PLP-dependent enzyme [Halorhodospira halophila]|uniref:Cysteine desulfurase n=1 Tax=Halorhodospira halophila (strain DSM 244 / SL1) TaxID=349124 RepID=A1WUG0_HALHL|nr:cysteine desulfurase [Halorhodospira halophila]ABM61322.1 L-selenocysteine selenide-lyase (L-alanine-forming) / cysteine desulfurase [Halorhodospira halophila SL1]MBK1729095.1 cysteine desulfurase [Halorhodospira halophila]